MSGPLLSVSDLAVAFPDGRGGWIRVVDDVSFSLGRGESLGIVGESGSGKTLTALSIIGLLPEGATVSGRVDFDGENLLDLDDEAMCRVRGARIAMVFQEPLSALNPAMRVGDQVAEGLVRQRGLGWRDGRRRAVDLLDRVRIRGAADKAGAYPHELSGGERQRVAIAIALALDPDLIIADEPTTALDVTVEGEVLDLLDDLVRDGERSLIVIGHDLGVIARAAARTVVMYAGTRLEEGPTASVLGRPLSPYARGLIDAVPDRRRRAGERLATIAGAVPSPSALGGACRFAPRCAGHQADCLAGEPGWTSFGARGVRCRHPLDAGEDSR